MPNHVTNILEFDCDGDKSREIIEFLKRDGEPYGSIDFNKLIPMPEDLLIDNGSETCNAIEVYLTAVNPRTVDYGCEKLSRQDFENMEYLLNREVIYGSVNSTLSEKEMQARTKGTGFAEAFKLGEKAVYNMRKYGATTWYHWRIKHWGSKWEAYDCEEVNPEDGCLRFCTAWNSVLNIVEKLSERFPDVLIHYFWADEDVGYNVGKAEFKGGRIVLCDVPEGGSKNAYAMAETILGYGEYEEDKENSAFAEKESVEASNREER